MSKIMANSIVANNNYNKFMSVLQEYINDLQNQNYDVTIQYTTSGDKLVAFITGYEKSDEMLSLQKEIVRLKELLLNNGIKY